MIETCSKSESTNAVINNKLERHKGLPVQQICVSLIFSVLVVQQQIYHWSQQLF